MKTTKNAVKSTRKTIDTKITTMRADEKISIGQVVANAISDKNAEKASFVISKENAKQGKADTKDITAHITSLSNDIHALKSLHSLTEIRRMTSSHDLFSKIDGNNNIGQFTQFDLDKTLAHCTYNADDYMVEISEMRATLAIINGVIEVFDEYGIYEKIRDDALPRWFSKDERDTSISFSEAKKILNAFLGENQAIFQAGKTTMSAEMSKVLVTPMVKFKKSSRFDTAKNAMTHTNEVSFAKKGQFYTELQKCIVMRVNGVALTTATKK